MEIEQASFEVGMGRLEKLAGILDNTPYYSQKKFFDESCGTPACALGHWWFHEAGVRSIICSPGNSVIDYCTKTFAINAEQVTQLFGVDGCGYAEHDSKKAAAYIRAFVKQRRVGEEQRAVAKFLAEVNSYLVAEQLVPV